MPTLTYAGYYDEAQIDPNTNQLLKGVPITVKTLGGAVATLYADKGRVAVLGNPVLTDTEGNLSFYADPGTYTLSYPGRATSHPIVVNLYPDEVSAGLVHTTGNESLGGIKTFTQAPVVPSGSFPEGAIAGLVNDLNAIRTRANGGGRTVNIVSDYGADNTGVVSSTAAFASANADLVARGGGVIICPPGTYLANLNLSALVSLLGWGFYLTRIQGVTGAGVPVVKADRYEGDFVKGVGIYGSLVWASGTPGANSDPEYGLFLYHSGSWWSAAVVEEVYVALSKGPGIGNFTQGTWINQFWTSYTGGRGITTLGGATDCIYTNGVCEPSIGSDSDYGIYAIGLASHWRNVKASVQGQVYDATIPGWKADNTNTTACGWGLGQDQDCFACISEDNPVGITFFNESSTFRGLSAGDRIPVRFNLLDPTYLGSYCELDIRCNDRFVPVKGAEIVEAFGVRCYLNIDWQSQSVSGSMSIAGKIKDQVGWKTFDDLSPTFIGLYAGNEFRVRGDEGGDFWDSASGTLTPDIMSGTQRFINVNGNMTINNFVDRYSLAWGRTLRFVLSASTTAGRKVTFGAGYNLPQPVVTLPAGITVMEFRQTSPGFTPSWQLVSKIPAGTRSGSVKRTSGSITLNQAATTTWADTGIADIVLANCAVGDKVEVRASGVWGNEAPTGYLDAASIVAGAPVNYWGGTGGGTDNGVLAWSSFPGGFVALGGAISKVLVAGDIATDGTVTLRLRYRVNIASTSKTLYAIGDISFFWEAENKGQVIV